MRFETAAPRTWLLATLAGWALLAWVLALAGMGGRTALLPDDLGLLQALPQPIDSPADRLGPLSEYSEIAARPLFADDRRTHPFSLQPDSEEDAEENKFDYVLTSVLITPGLHMAIVQPTQGGESVRVKLDTAIAQIPAWRLVTLDPRRAVFEGPGGRKSLDLRVFDGTGGEAPTLLRGAEASAGTSATNNGRPQPAQNKAGTNMAGNGGASNAGADANNSARPVSQPSPPIQQVPPPTSTGQSEQSQIEAIRKRIEARRAQLRQTPAQTAPASTP